MISIESELVYDEILRMNSRISNPENDDNQTCETFKFREHEHRWSKVHDRICKFNR